MCLIGTRIVFKLVRSSIDGEETPPESATSSSLVKLSRAVAPLGLSLTEADRFELGIGIDGDASAESFTAASLSAPMN